MDNTDNTRLSKYLAAAGVASRRGCEEIIAAGRVAINGKVTLLPHTRVEEKDVVTLDGKAIQQEEKKVYYILNKPTKYLCSSKKIGSTKIVLDLFADVPYRLFTIGRLDKDTQGLLLLTNDGDFAHQVIHPSKEIHKEYLAKTDKEITDSHLKAISKGTLVEGVLVKPVRITKIRRGTLKIVIGEGRKREVRVLLEAAGLIVKELTRIRIGGLHLGPLPLGAWRELSEREKSSIFE